MRDKHLKLLRGKLMDRAMSSRKIDVVVLSLENVLGIDELIHRQKFERRVRRNKISYIG